MQQFEDGMEAHNHRYSFCDKVNRRNTSVLTYLDFSKKESSILGLSYLIIIIIIIIYFILVLPSLAGFSRPGDLQRPHLSHVPGAAVAARAGAAGGRGVHDVRAAAQRGDVQRSGGGDGAVEVELPRNGV